MNIFFRELKSHRSSLLFWCLGMLFLVGSGMAKYGAYQSTGQSMNQILDQFPKTVQIVFGISGFDLSTVGGYFGLLFMYIALMGTVHAVLLGSDIVSKEERDRTSEFLFVKPISRMRAITAKLLAGLFNIIVLNLLTVFSSIYFVNYFNKNKESVGREVWLLMAGLFFLQLIFFLIGTAIAAINKKTKAAPGMSTTILLVTFILSFLINLNSKLDILKYLTPFKYFDTRDILANNKLDPIYLGLSGVIIVLLTLVTYRFFSKRDLNI